MCGDRTRSFGSSVWNPLMWNGPARYVIVWAEAVPAVRAIVATITRASSMRSFIAGADPRTLGGWTGTTHERIASPEVTFGSARDCSFYDGGQALGSLVDVRVGRRERQPRPAGAA